MDNNLNAFRQKIDLLDKKILNLLAKRTLVSRKIGHYKKRNNVKPLDEERWQKVLEKNLESAKSLNLDLIFIKQIFSLIHKYSLKIQKEK